MNSDRCNEEITHDNMIVIEKGINKEWENEKQQIYYLCESCNLKVACILDNKIFRVMTRTAG